MISPNWKKMSVKGKNVHRYDVKSALLNYEAINVKPVYYFL